MNYSRENSRGIFAAGGPTNEFPQFKVDLIYVPISLPCDSFSIR